ncbi:MAG: YegP family protein [Oscillospiraceae bacterium]|nr:YegP family protein [Oscillospiraceae bacterium]
MGKFEIKNVKSGVKFDLKATNGEVIATSEVYTTEAACRKGIESVRNNALSAVEDQTVEPIEVQKHPKYEVYLDKAGEYRFRLKARNGEIIATGEGYKKKASCLNGIDSIKRNAPEAVIIKVEA